MKATPRRFTATLSFWSLMALVFGLGLGIYGFETGNAWVAGLARGFQPLGMLWMNALQMAVVPLVVFQLLTSIVGNGDSLGNAGRRSVATIALLLGSLATLSYFLSAPLVRLFSISPVEVAAIRNTVLVPQSVQDAAVQAPVSFMDSLLALVPGNVLEALVNGELLQILLVTVVFGMAVNRLPDEQRKPLREVFKAMAAAILVVIRWILLATPIGVLALVMGLALSTGAGAAGLLGFYVVVDHVVLAAILLLLYPVVALLGRVSIKTFARAAAGPQLIALSTRSSIATMPAQIESGKKYLGFSETTSGFVVPLMVSTLKIQSVIGNSTRVLFLAHIFGVALTVPQLVTFTVTVLLISFATVGVPNGGGSFRTLPAYVAIGIPIEGLVLLQAVKDLRDYLTTVANTTGQFAAATILSRGDRVSAPEASGVAAGFEVTVGSGGAAGSGVAAGHGGQKAADPGTGWIEAPSLQG